MTPSHYNIMNVLHSSRANIYISSFHVCCANIGNVAIWSTDKLERKTFKNLGLLLPTHTTFVFSDVIKKLKFKEGH